jgi:hypothetical protein
MAEQGMVKVATSPDHTMEMQQGNTAQTSSTDMQHGQTVWASTVVGK